MRRHPPTAAVSQSFGEAQQQAAAMVAGPPVPWNAAARAKRRHSARWLGVAAVSVVASGVAGWFGADWLSDAGRAGSPAAPEPSAAAPAVTLPPLAPAPVVEPVVAAPPPSLTVTRRAGVIRIESTQAPLADAVRALAQATSTRLRGGEALAALTAPVTLQWQGSDTAAAWDALLGRHANIALSCSGANCELWIVGVNPPRAAGASVAAGEPAPTRSVPQPPPPPADGEESSDTN